MTDLMLANREWQNRPADERFESLEQMLVATTRHREVARTVRNLEWNDLEVNTDGRDIFLSGPAKTQARMRHYAFGQVCTIVGAPASYLRTLPPEMVVDNLRYGLRNNVIRTESPSLLVERVNGDVSLRAITTTDYTRVWNNEVIGRLIDVSNRYGLVPARSTFNWDGSPVADESERPASLYASDHDMFAFLMSPDRGAINHLGKPVYRGVITRNSEVGDGALKIMGFLFVEICGNHIIWGASEIAEIKLVHRANISERWSNAQIRIRKYFDSTGDEDKLKFADLNVRIAGTKDEVLDKLFGLKAIGLPRKTLAASWDAVVPDEDGDPMTKWGFAQGITRFSQTLPNASDRQKLDAAAGRLLSAKF